MKHTGGIKMRLKDKVAIITGSGAGIGKGMALAMAKEGAHIVMVEMNEEAGNETFKELTKYSPAHLIIKDVSIKESAQEVIDETLEKFGKIDILVNNVHVLKNALFEDTNQDLFDLSFGTGFYPTVHFMQAAFPELKKSKGKVINLASGAGIEGQATQTSYAAAKEAIRGITRVAAGEWGQYGINVNIISPIAHTPGIEQWKAFAPEQFEEMLNDIPMGRLGDAEKDIGRTAVFLASSDSDFITGQTIMVDGGAIMLR